MSKNPFQPRWIEQAPTAGSYRSIFKWGAPEAFKHPNRRLVDLVKKTFHMTDADFTSTVSTGNEPVTCDAPVRIPPEKIEALKAIAGDSNVSTDDYSRVKYASGKTAEEALKLRRGIVEGAADVVVHPRGREDVQKIVAFCHEQKIPLYPYGGGSSVNFGFQCVHGGVSLVLSTHMNRVLGFSEANQTITVEPGILGPAYEELLNQAPERLGAKRRYTGGHFPQSFEYSTVGGWIAALGAGQQSSYYGDAYDIVIGQEYVTPAGTFRTLDYPATATGPKVNDIMKGSEGAFGVLVGATLRVFRYLPENRQRFSFVFPTWESAVDAAREISQGEFGMPAVFRISDPEETDVGLKLYGVEGTVIDRMMSLRGFRPMQRCLCLGHTEGEKDFSENVRKKIRQICRQHGAMDATSYPAKKWEHGRYTDPYMREDMNDFGVVIDTLESAVTWDNLHALHQGVRGFVKSRPDTICMTHASHFYPQGTNLYFIFIARMSDIDEYRELQAGIIDRIQEYGGSLSHHHGVGKMIAPWMEAHLGSEQMGVLRALKKHFDPRNIMNPGGTLGLDLPGPRKRKPR
jgi:alkyldihydroxyacetonephosphate synthase